MLVVSELWDVISQNKIAHILYLDRSYCLIYRNNQHSIFLIGPVHFVSVTDYVGCKAFFYNFRLPYDFRNSAFKYPLRNYIKK